VGGTWVGRLPVGGDEDEAGLEVLVQIDDAGRATLAVRDPEDWNPVWGPPRPLERRDRVVEGGPSW
jgi:hypothetical protein